MAMGNLNSFEFGQAARLSLAQECNAEELLTVHGRGPAVIDDYIVCENTW